MARTELSGIRQPQRATKALRSRAHRSGSTELGAPGEAPPLRTRQFKAFRIGLSGSLGVGVGLLVWGAVSSLTTVFSYIGLALFITLGVDPVVRWLGRRGMPRPAAVVLVLASLLVLVGILVLVLIPVFIQQSKELIGQIPVLVGRAVTSDWVNDMEQLLSGYVDVNALVQSIGTFFSKPANLLSLGGGLLAVGSGIAGGATGALIVFVLTLYFVVTLPRMKRAAYQLVPASRRPKFIEVTEEISTAVSSYVLGQLALALLNGVLSAVFLSLVHAPVPLLLALLAFVGALVPLVGTVVSAVVITLVSLVTSAHTALFVGIYYLLYMQVEAYILTPRIMNRAVAVPGSLVVIAAIAGGTLGGILGALVAIPLAASAIIVVHKVVLPRQNRL